MIKEVQIKESDQVIEVVINGTDSSRLTANDFHEAWSRIVQTCNSKQIYNVITYLNLSGNISANTAITLASNPDTLFGWTKNIQMAIIHSNEKSEPSTSIYGIMEAIASNRGFEIRNFWDKESALRWLEVHMN